MIVEHEIIEQLEEEPTGRSLEWVVGFAAELGCPDPLLSLRQMCGAGYVTLTDLTGRVLPSWWREEVWREGRPRSDVFVMATDQGSRWVHG